MARQWWTAVALMAAVIVVVTANNELARGWGDSIQWKDLESGLDEAKTNDKPLMLIIHKSWCGACKSLKPKFADSKEIAELSEEFIMVNTLDDEEPQDAKYSPDGGYIPRIFFLNPNGEIISDVFNPQYKDKYMYYYPNADAIVASMKIVAQNRGISKNEL